MADEEASLILSQYVEPRLIKVCRDEGILKLSDEILIEMHRHLETTVSDFDRSQIFSSVFLCPTVHLNLVRPTDILDQSDAVINFRAGREEDGKQSSEFDDFNLLCSYTAALQPDLTPSRIITLIADLKIRSDAVISKFGAIPSSDGHGNPITMGDLISAAIRRAPRPIYPPDHLAAYREYSRAADDARNILQCSEDLSRTWARKHKGDRIAIHPAVTRSYNRILTEAEVSKISDETEIFFLAIRELQTLPVGRTLRETLDLARTQEGVAIRERVRELSETVGDGTSRGLEIVLEKIKAEADEYRSLTARLQSPHRLSRVTDVALNVAGLAPVIGTLASFGALAKSAGDFAMDRNTREKLNSILWTQYKGTSI